MAGMDGITCTVTTLASGGQPSPGTVRQAEGSRTELLTPERIEPGALVQLEWENTLVLGEVRACRPEEAGYFSEIEIEHLLRPRELANLLRALLDAR